MPADIRLDANGGESLLLQGQDVMVEGRLRVGGAANVAGPVTLAGPVCIEGRLTLSPTTLAEQRLPAQANHGDLFLLITEEEGFGGMRFTKTSLWLCVPPEQPSTDVVTASWREIQLGPVTLGG